MQFSYVLLLASLVLLGRLSSVHGAYYFLWLDSNCNTTQDDNVAFSLNLLTLPTSASWLIAEKQYSTFLSTGIATCSYAQNSQTQYVYTEVTWANNTGVQILINSGFASAGYGFVSTAFVNNTLANTSLPLYALLNGTAQNGVCTPMQFCENRFATMNTSYVGSPYNLPCITGYITVDCTGATAPVYTSSSGLFSSSSSSSFSSLSVSLSSTSSVSSSALSSSSSVSALPLSSSSSSSTAKNSAATAKPSLISGVFIMVIAAIALAMTTTYTA